MDSTEEDVAATGDGESRRGHASQQAKEGFDPSAGELDTESERSKEGFDPTEEELGAGGRQAREGFNPTGTE